VEQGQAGAAGRVDPGKTQSTAAPDLRARSAEEVRVRALEEKSGPASPDELVEVSARVATDDL
jgi:hypothetical protein